MNEFAQLPDEDNTLVPAVHHVRVGRHDVINVVKSDVLPIATGLYRVVWANRKTNCAFVLRFPSRQEEKEISTGTIRVKQKLHWPTFVHLDELEKIAEKRWLLKTKAFVPKRLNKDAEELTAAEQSAKSRRKIFISNFSSDNDLIRIFEAREMGRYVARAVEEHNSKISKGEKKLTRYHVYQIVYRFWLYACRESALISDNAKCGAPGKYRNPGNKKRGRRPLCVITGHAPAKVGVNTGPDDRALIWLAWDLYGCNLGQYAFAYNKMIEHYFTEGWHETDRGWTPTKTALEKRPSLEVFRYYVHKKYTPIELLKQMLPAITWQQTKRALRGKSFDKLFGPAQVYMIDSTVADVYLVSEFNPYWIIGRPIVYLIRDVWSGMIVGVHVALEGPSWETARLAVFNAFSPKGEYLRSLGFNMTDADWPCAHGCLEIFHDRGEHLSIPSTDSANDLRIVLSVCPPFRPDPKGGIETMFHWLRDATVKWLPGAVMSRERERGQRDYRLDATLTLHGFTRIIVHAILTFNKTANVSDRLVGPLSGLEIEATPINLWRYGLENLNGSPPQWDQETLYNALLPNSTASIRADGVRFAGRCYKGHLSDMAQWQESARAFHSQKIKIKYHPNDPRSIYILNESTGNYETFTDTAPEQLPKNARLEEVLDCRQYRKFMREAGKDIRLLDRVAHNRFRDEEIKLAAESRAQAIAPASKAEHLSDIQAKRAFEAQVQRTMEAYQRTNKDRDITDVEAVSDEYEAPTSLLSKLLAEAEEVTGNE
jgi:hypothetical protein